MSKDWLQNLKEGDQVVVVSDYGTNQSLYKVHRLTKTLIVINIYNKYQDNYYEIKFNRRTGSNETRYLAEATESVIKQINFKRTKKTIKKKLEQVIKQVDSLTEDQVNDLLTKVVNLASL